MEQLKLKDVLKRKNYDDSPNKRRWKNQVLIQCYEQGKLEKETIKESKKTRRKLERSLDAAREVINVFQDYTDEYGQAITRFKKRIEKDEQAKEIEKKSLEDQEKTTNTNTEPSDKSIDFLRPCVFKKEDSKVERIKRFYKNNPNLRRPRHSSKALPTTTIGHFRF